MATLLWWLMVLVVATFVLVAVLAIVLSPFAWLLSAIDNAAHQRRLRKGQAFLDRLKAAENQLAGSAGPRPTR